MSFSRTRPVAKQHRHAGGAAGTGRGIFRSFRSFSFANRTNTDVNGGKYAVNGGSFDFAAGQGRDLAYGGQAQRRHAAADDFVAAPPVKRRRSAWGDADGGGGCWRASAAVPPCGNGPSTSESSFLRPTAVAARHNAGFRSIPSDSGVAFSRPQAALEDDEETVLMSRDEIERCSPSRRDGIDLLRETHLRYSYCAFLQNLGMRLDLPHTTIGTAMVLCHRFFVRRSHACHDRFLIATAALFLAAKSEETPCPLNTVLRASCEICHKQDPAFFPYLLPVDWFEQYRERVIEAEQMILTTLNFELNVQHPYTPLTSVLDKLGLSETVLINLAWNLINEGLRSSLWLQFKPHHIAAGAAFLAAKFLNFDLACHQSIWLEFQTTPSILRDVVQQLMELF